MSKILIDTNLFLDDSNIIFKLAREYDKILLPLTILKELDAHKTNSNASFSARKAIQSILEFKEEYSDKIIFDIDSHKNLSKEATNDDKIIQSASMHKAAIATKDTSMVMQAEALGLETKIFDVVLNHIFNPYKHVHMNKLYDLTEEDIFAFNKYYEGTEYARMMGIFAKACGEELDRDSWFFVFINVEQEDPVIYANNVNERMFQRIDNDPNYIYLKVDDSTIKTADSYQKCAVFALKEAPHCLITGRWGSGKTLLGTAYALSSGKKKTFITRAPIGINSKYDLGFLPGDKKDKMINWMQGFLSALYFIYANTRCQKDEKNGKTYDFVKDNLFHEKFELLPMNTIQGLSLLDGDTLIVDEAQLITIDYMSMILSRPSAHGKLILLGDLKQTYGVVKPSESGLLKLLRTLPHRSLAYVQLENSYRSPLLEVADKLQDKTFY